MDLRITMLGTAASAPTAARGTAATLLVRGGLRVLVDCGEGTQRQLLRSGTGLVDLEAILITHMHADHVLGLPGLLKTYALRARTQPLRLVGPRGLAAFMQLMGPLIGRLPFPLEQTEVGGGGAAWREEGLRIEAFDTSHRVPSVGYALLEDDRPGAFDVDAAAALGVPPGPMFGVLQRGGEVQVAGGTVRFGQVLGPARSGRRVVITGDTEPCAGTVQAAAGADVLVHEATFLEAERDRARETGHSTAREAAEVARQAGVSLLALTHISSRFMPRDVRAEAREVFPNTVTPRDFDRIEVPFRERGAPALVRADGPDGAAAPTA